jgi:hypothetical protein
MLELRLSTENHIPKASGVGKNGYIFSIQQQKKNHQLHNFEYLIFGTLPIRTKFQLISFN